MHGANARRAEQHPGFRHGRYARYGSAKLQRLIDQTRRNPQQREPMTDLVLFDALMQLRLRQVRGERRDFDQKDEDALMKLSGAKLAAWDREMKRQHVAAGFISRADFQRTLTALAAAVRRHVIDQGVLSAIRDDFRRLVRSYVAIDGDTNLGTGAAH